MPIFNQVVQGGGGSGPAYYIEYALNAQNELVKKPNTFIDLTGVTKIGPSAFPYMYQNQSSNTALAGVLNLPNITECYGFYYTFQNCTQITGLNMPALVKLGGSGYAFNGCSNLETINMDNLEEITSECSRMFVSTKITVVGFPSLKKANAYNGMYEWFGSCSRLVCIYFQSLNKINQSSVLSRFCQSCTSLQSIWFYALDTNSFGSYYTTQFTNMFSSSVTGCTIHFPKNLDPQTGDTTISGLNGYPNFGGTNTVLLFDIVTSLTGADGNTYTRSEKDSTSTATAWTYNDTLYYTSGVSNNTAGVNEPSVSDAIYSDAACTTSVTTITAIA